MHPWLLMWWFLKSGEALRNRNPRWWACVSRCVQWPWVPFPGPLGTWWPKGLILGHRHSLGLILRRSLGTAVTSVQNLFRNTDRCPRTLIFFQASVTFILLPPLIFTRQWVLYCTLLCLNYILLLWCIHLRKTLLQRTLPQARHLANNSFSALASLTDVTYAAGAKVS